MEGTEGVALGCDEEPAVVAVFSKRGGVDRRVDIEAE